MRYYVIWVGTTPINGAVFTDYITTDQSVNRALRSDLLSIGTRSYSFDEAMTYAQLEFADVPPSVMYPELQHAPGANNIWLNFQRYREEESSISDGTHFREVAQPEGHFLDRAVPDGSQELYHSIRIQHGLASTSPFHEHREQVYVEMDELSRYLMCTAPLPPKPVFISHIPPFSHDLVPGLRRRGASALTSVR